MDDRTRDIVEKIAATLREWRENHFSVFGEFPAEPFCQPAADFETIHGISGIAGRYVLPEGLSPSDLQAYARRIWRQEHIPTAVQQENLSRLWHVLAAYNPELRQIPHDPRDTDALYHMIMGVASAYNLDDIRFFLSDNDVKDKAWRMERSPEFAALTEIFNRTAPAQRPNLKWAAAPETLRLICAKMAEKHKLDF